MAYMGDPGRITRNIKRTLTISCPCALFWGVIRSGGLECLEVRTARGEGAFPGASMCTWGVIRRGVGVPGCEGPHS